MVITRKIPGGGEIIPIKTQRKINCIYTLFCISVKPPINMMASYHPYKLSGRDKNDDW